MVPFLVRWIASVPLKVVFVRRWVKAYAGVSPVSVVASSAMARSLSAQGSAA